MEDKPISEQESLAIITDMLHRVKHSYVDNGLGPLLWGTLIIICSLTSFAQRYFAINLGFDIWLLTIVALMAQVYFSWRERKHQKFRTLDGDAMHYTWLTFGIVLFMLTYLNNVLEVKGAASYFIMIYGIPTFITGGIKRFKPMIIGGILCWIFCLISAHTNFLADMLLMAAAALVAWLIPGIILRKRYLKIVASV